MTIKVGSTYFSAGGNVPASVYGDTATLAKALQGVVVELGRLKVIEVNPGDFTDNSTGVSAGSIVDLVLPTAAYDATSAGGSPRAALNTAIGKIENAMAVVAENMATTRTALGLTALTYAGTVATPGTIPALDKTLTATNGTSAVDYVSGTAKLTELKGSMRELVHCFNEVLVAVGATPLASALTGDFTLNYAIAAIADADASATGASSISDTVADAFLTAAAANIASMATKWNATFPLSATAPLQVVAAA